MKGENVVKEIQIKNFRSLKDTGSQKLSPITILVGENSSGKSTFLRAFPLLKQSISKRTSGPILWAGDLDDYVDFGSFEETVTNDGSDEIVFNFKFDVKAIGWFNRNFTSERFFSETTTEPKFDKVEYQITIKSINGKDQVTQFSLKLNSILYKFDIVNQSVAVGDFFLYRNKKNSPVDPNMRTVRERGFLIPYSRSFGFYLPDISELWSEINDTFSQLFGKESSMRANVLEFLVDLGDRISLNLDPMELCEQFKEDDKTSKKYSQIYRKLAELLSEKENSRLKGIIELCYLYGIYSDIDEYISVYFRNVHYIAPLRATAERYYRLRNLAVDEVDYQGKNLAIFINSLNGNRLRAFQSWTEDHFGFHVKTDISKGHLSLQIILRNSDKAINLSDTGFGYSQVLPIITQLWELSSRSQHAGKNHYSVNGNCPLVVAIEQPELHLHPAVQAKLAKAFISCIDLARKNGNELQLILETHSETIINYFGRAIAKGSLNNEDVSIVLFEKQISKSTTDVRNSIFDDDGYLSNWPYGFFDPEE